MVLLKTLTLITKDDFLAPVDGPTGLLIEAAPDADLPGDQRQRVPFRELVGLYEEAKAWAFRTTQALIADDPVIEGIRHLHVIEESIIQELERIFHVLRLHEWLESHQVETAVFRADSPFADSLAELEPFARYKVRRPPVRSEKLLSKGLQSAGDQGWQATLRRAAERFFPAGARLLLSHRRRNSFSKGAAWLYSTAYTYTGILLEYEPFIPGPVHVLYESSEPGSVQRLRERNDAFDIFSWGDWSDLPARSLAEESRRRLRHHLENVPLPPEDALARTMLLRGAMFRTFLLRRLPIFLLKARLSRKWMEEAQPKLIVVGNPAAEGPLLQLAEQQGVPTVLLQHGTLGDYYQYSTQPCETLLVRGPFWKEFVAEPMRGKTLILNANGGNAASPAGSNERGAILFVSSIEAALPTTHPRETLELIRVLLECARREDRTLIVRVHPRESLEHYRRIVGQALESVQGKVTVEFSQGAGLEDVLRRSSVAVMYSSTIFLDCLRAGVPIVSVGWVDFAYRSLLEKHDVFSFAKSFAELKDLVARGARGELARRSSYEEFLAATPAEELRGFFAGCLAGETRRADTGSRG